MSTKKRTTKKTKPTTDVISTPIPSQESRIPLSDIHADLAWNARSGSWILDTDPATGAGFAAMKASVEAAGFDTPIYVRRNSDASGTPYLLISGFRRFAVATELGHETILAKVFDLDELGARLLNIRENTARESLKPADIAWAIHQLARAPGATDALIANNCALSVGYVGSLKRIMRDVLPVITNQWRQSLVEISVADMLSLTNVPPDMQEEAFRALIAPSSTSSDSLKPTYKKAFQAGALLARLEHERIITIEQAEWEEIAIASGAIKRTASRDATALAARAAVNGYDGYHTCTDEEGDLENLDRDECLKKGPNIAEDLSSKTKGAGGTYWPPEYYPPEEEADGAADEVGVITY